MDRLAAMEAFVVVVDTGSFSAAARRLNVGQPAVSKMVAQLEERLGVKLLVRTTHGLTATEPGLNYYERARRSIEEADEAELAARGAASSLRGKLRVSAAVTFARIHLMPRLPEFLAKHPDLEIFGASEMRCIIVWLAEDRMKKRLACAVHNDSPSGGPGTSTVSDETL
jgi:DNA-binding transcriptional LysR family regulator